MLYFRKQVTFTDGLYNYLLQTSSYLKTSNFKIRNCLQLYIESTCHLHCLVVI